MNALSYAQGSDANKPVSVWLALLGFLVLYCTFTELTLAANKVSPTWRSDQFVDPWLLVPKKDGIESTCMGESCLERAITRGRGLEHFMWRLDQMTNREGMAGHNGSHLELRLVLLGNSVAREGDYAVAKKFIQSILAAYPMLRFNEDYADLVKGGFDVGHLLNCGLEKYQTADVILVHYEEFSAKGSARQLLRRLQRLPHQPLVLVIKHCQMPQLEMLVGGVSQSEWVKRYWASDTNELFERFSQVESQELRLLREFGVTFVDSCTLLRILLMPKQCPLHFNSLKELKQHMFTLPRQKFIDGLHQSPLYCELQGCLVAQAILGSQRIENATFPPFIPVQERQAKVAPSSGDWCLEAGQDNFWNSITQNRGWELKKGGRGGSKVWLEANATGQMIEFKGRATGSTVAVEHYIHDSLPMGLAEATLTLHRGSTQIPYKPVLLDGRCNTCLKDQGFYVSTVLARGVQYGDDFQFTLRLELVPRTDGRRGTRFSLVSVLAYGAYPTPHGYNINGTRQQKNATLTSLYAAYEDAYKRSIASDNGDASRSDDAIVVTQTLASTS